MLKVIGVLAIVAVAGLGALAYFGWADVHPNVELTHKAHTQIQQLRQQTADVIAGQSK